MNLDIKPISPNIALRAEVNIGAIVARVNEALSKPWTSSEVNRGRWLDIAIFGATAERETVVAAFVAFLAEGWQIEAKHDMHGGSYVVFRPPAPVHFQDH